MHTTAYHRNYLVLLGNFDSRLLSKDTEYTTLNIALGKKQEKLLEPLELFCNKWKGMEFKPKQWRKGNANAFTLVITGSVYVRRPQTFTIFIHMKINCTHTWWMSVVFLLLSSSSFLFLMHFTLCILLFNRSSILFIPFEPHTVTTEMKGTERERAKVKNYKRFAIV